MTLAGPANLQHIKTGIDMFDLGVHDADERNILIVDCRKRVDQRFAILQTHSARCTGFTDYPARHQHIRPLHVFARPDRQFDPSAIEGFELIFHAGVTQRTPQCRKGA